MKMQFWSKGFTAALTLFIGLFSGLLTSTVQAEQMVAHGDYIIHYNAFNSSFIQPNVAKSYGIKRSKTIGLLNVSVLHKQADGTAKAVSAIVQGKVTNLISQNQTLDFSKVEETDALYYIGDFGFTDDQVLRFSLQVQPDPNTSAYEINFEQRFYVD
ncbi:DUF4426 domain-containing protein [Amphritea balenae]|uniref:DUF4426 domain-containing protein n=1 Tax=Amphritea balenae TaxID=452629 RepID=A0A3P1SIS8_9GAMM|nr:DUF4426 domain-containing protein [Amphritea balenae]RRC97183.1 DUF4426 domain-containing protein [Amphritea balenae]GGK63952.1 hypothetical protein GCM10007941_12660 [Amphritea balenae]